MKTIQVPKLQRDTKGLKLFPLFTLLGWGLIIFAGLVVLGFIVSPTGAAYWGSNAKAARDAAATGSLLVSQLSTLALWKHIVPPLLILGIASFMVGIAMEFASIPSLLDKRTATLKQALPLMGKK
ncbi:MAG: hypothetical protein GWP61_27445 [Chloroflexi bacterium]|jgi:hypothetical protein|nr:hypothetical protein [Chloroflexota bacterium]